MTKTVRALLVLIGALLFAVGLLVGQKTQISKYQKYFRTGTISEMDFAVLQANLEIVRRHMLPQEVPTVEWKGSCGCFVAGWVVTSAFMKSPLDEVRASFLGKALVVRQVLEEEFPELSKPGTVPDGDLRMTFFELNLQKPDASHEVAEYLNGKIIFK
jgi:hypothetical protein